MANAEARNALAKLEGTLAATRSRGSEAKRGLPHWARVGVHGRAPTLLPRLPSGERLVESWRARGVGLWLSEGLALIETPSGTLAAHDAFSGRLLWEVPSLRTSAPRGYDASEDLRDERASLLSWAVAPWGAVEVVADMEAPLGRRRVGRWHAELGRVTETAPTERAATEIRLSTQIVLPDETWTDRRPTELIVERAGPGEPLAGSSMRLREWFEELGMLSLDPASPSFGVSWGPPDEWAIFDISYGVLGPAGWEPDDGDPFEVEAPLTCPGPEGSTFRVEGERLLHEAKGEVLAEHSLDGLESPQLIGADNALLVAGFRGRTAQLLRLDWDATALSPWPEQWPESFDGRVRLVGWNATSQDEALCGQLLVASGMLFVQQGGDVLIAYGPA